MARRRRSAALTQRKRKRVESTDQVTNTSQDVNPNSSSIALPSSSVLVANSSESSFNVTPAASGSLMTTREFKPSNQTSVDTLPVANNSISIPVITDINSVNCDIPSSNNSMFYSNVDTIQSVQRPSVIQRVSSSANVVSTSSYKNPSLESSGDHQSLERNINLGENPGCRTQSETGGESFGTTNATPASLSDANQEVIVIDDDHVGDAAPGPSGTQIPNSDKAMPVKSDDCPVCLQTPVHPSRLPCSHVFCYLCLKGIALSGQTCPLCRAIIPFHYSQNPQLVPDISNSQDCNEDTDEKFCWFYEGRNGGWWQFEKRMSEEIDSNVENGSPRFEMMICGSLYIIDTCLNIQFPKNYPGKVRKLLRERPSRINLKGVAGILRSQIPSTSTLNQIKIPLNKPHL